MESNWTKTITIDDTNIALILIAINVVQSLLIGNEYVSLVLATIVLILALVKFELEVTIRRCDTDD